MAFTAMAVRVLAASYEDVYGVTLERIRVREKASLTAASRATGKMSRGMFSATIFIWTTPCAAPAWGAGSWRNFSGMPKTAEPVRSV